MNIKFYCLILILCLNLSALWAQTSLFASENGPYVWSFKEIQQLYTTKIPYVRIGPNYKFSSDLYKLNGRSEFQMSDWYLKDWYTLQDYFILNIEGYLIHFKGATFNEAKRNSYRQMTFNSKTLLHNKLVPFMKEWGGLNHPPVKTLDHPIEKYSSSHKPVIENQLPRHYFMTQLQQEIDLQTKSELSFGNKLQLLADRDSWTEKKRLIRNAKKTIFMSSLVFVCDSSTQEIINLLKTKHKEGLDIRVIADKTISKLFGHRKCLKQLIESGVEVIEANDFWNYRGKTIYHTKMLTVDFQHSIVGGQNMIDADNTSRGVNFKNRDLDLKVTGPLVSDMAMAFIKDWNHFHTKGDGENTTSLVEYQKVLNTRILSERRLGLRGSSHYQDILNHTTDRLSGVCRYIRQSPFEDQYRIGKGLLLLMKQVQQYLVLTNPINTDSKVTSLNRDSISWLDRYDSFQMFNKLFDQTQILAKQGKRIDYLTTNIDMAGNENVAILNQKISEKLSEGKDLFANWDLIKLHMSNRFYGKSHYKNLIKDWLPYSNVHIWTHISFLHSKVYHFDRVVAAIGSYNFHHNATDHAYEGTVICQDRELNKALDKELVLDMANSIPLIFKGSL